MSWIHRLLGKDGTTQLGIDPKHFAARVAQRPMEVGARGAYHAAFYTGVLPAALGANSEIFQFRFVHASFQAMPRRVLVAAAVSTTAFAAGVPVAIEMRHARSWSAQGTLGTGITWGSNDGKKKTSHASTVLAAGDVRIATTAALGAGTKTLDGTPCGHVLWQPGTAVNQMNLTPIWERIADAYPPNYLNQEGFVIRSVEVPATGTWKACIVVEWDEIDPAGVDGWT